MSVIAFILGAVIGKFVNLVIDHLPVGKAIIPARANGDNAGQRLKPWDMIPILGHLLWQKRSGGYSAGRLSRVLLVEVISGAAFLLIYLKYGLTPQWGVLVFYFSLFLTVAVIDLEHGLIPNKLVYPSCLVALLLTSFYPLGLAAGRAPLDSFLYSLFGGAVAFIILLIPALLWESGMGWGDVKLAGLIGLATGFPGGLVALALAIIGGGLLAIVFVSSGLKKRRESIPFGPFLSAGALVALIWGRLIADWYLGLAL